MTSVRILAGDIGGTNARLVLYETDATSDFKDVKAFKNHHIVAQRNFKNDDFKSFSDVLLAFLAINGVSDKPINTCCFAVAGPVINNRINFTNRDGWIIDRATIETDFQIQRVELVNDFVAAGHGVLSLTEDELVTLQPGKSRPDAPKALVGAGTGLGECYLARSPGAEFASAFPTEGGHVEFAPRSQIEEELLTFLQHRFAKHHATVESEPIGFQDPNLNIGEERTRVSVERVLSGPGLENIYEFLRFKYPEDVDESLDAQYNDSTERGRFIGMKQYNYGLFRRALEIMFGIYGSEVGNVALKYLPYGGLYIAGGIAPKNVELMKDNNSLFMHRFLRKGRMSSIMTGFPVHVVMKEDLGLRGAHIVASRLVNEVLNVDSVQMNGDAGDDASSRSAVIPNGLVPVKPDTLRNAVADYPMTYAWVTGITSIATASFMALSAIAFSRGRKHD